MRLALSEQVALSRTALGYTGGLIALLIAYVNVPFDQYRNSTEIDSQGEAIDLG